MSDQAAGFVSMNRFRANPTTPKIRLRMVLLLATGWLAVLPFWAAPCRPANRAAASLPEVASSSCCRTAGEDAQTAAWQPAAALPWSPPACNGTCTLSDCEANLPLVESQAKTEIEHRRLAVGPVPAQVGCRPSAPGPSMAGHPLPRPSIAPLPAYLASSALRC